MKFFSLAIFLFSAILVISCDQTSVNNQQLILSKEDVMLSIHYGDQTLLGYQYRMIHPPEGEDAALQELALRKPI
jgi:hypothetical protein